MDPLDSKYPGLSPYVYVGNDPISYYDPNGMDRAFHESTKDPRFQAAYNLYLKTEMGAAQAKKFDEDERILVVYTTANLSETAVGMTRWLPETQYLDVIEYESPKDAMDISNQKFANNGKLVIMVYVDINKLEKYGQVESAETIYHEGRCHIEYDIDANNKNISSETLNATQEHRKCGKEYVNKKARKNSDADKFIKQAQNAYNNMNKKSSRKQSNNNPDSKDYNPTSGFNAENSECPF